MLLDIGKEKHTGVLNQLVCPGLLLLGFAFIFVFAGSVSAGTYFEDFNDGRADGWVVLTGTWEVIDDEYHMPVAVKPPDPPHPIAFALGGKEFGEFSMEGEFRNDEFHAEGNQSHSGFAFGMDKEGSGYLLYFRYHKGITCATGALALRWGFAGGSKGCDPDADIAESCDVFDAQDMGNWHILRIEVSDAKKSLKAWVDGEEAMDVELDKSAAGKLGLWTGRIGAASFDNISIAGANVPSSAVEAASKLFDVWGGIKAQCY